MEKDDAMETLARQVELLCARCDALGREIRRLRAENRRLRDNSSRAKQKIRDIMTQLPEVGAGDGAGRTN